MFCGEFFDASLWWIFPLVMIVLCIVMMWGRRGSMMCGFGPHEDGDRTVQLTDSAGDRLDKRYARGEIDKEEYEEKKSALTSIHDLSR
jgi:uncharacterized membrane protein